MTPGRPLAMKPSEHVLHHVFGRLVIADEQHREPHKTEPMQAKEGDQVSIRDAAGGADTFGAGSAGRRISLSMIYERPAPADPLLLHVGDPEKDPVHPRSGSFSPSMFKRGVLVRTSRACEVSPGRRRKLG
ncbi:hypothetical protein GCM10010176_082310 [Nonomuraea spiralis]|nr:hypothetical protein GCM10010176_082310 [Nonomuraea spiralis]